MPEALEFPRYCHHAHEPPRRVETQAEYDALVAEDADWRPWPWSDEDKAAWQASHAPAEREGEDYSPRRRR